MVAVSVAMLAIFECTVATVFAAADSLSCSGDHCAIVLEQDEMSLLQVNVNQHKGLDRTVSVNDDQDDDTSTPETYEWIRRGPTTVVFEAAPSEPGSLHPELRTSDDPFVEPEEDELVSGETHYMSGDWRPSTDIEAKAFLDETNKYRCMHGANPLKWSDDVAANAEGYIDGMTEMVHSASYDIPPPAGPAGENLAWREEYPSRITSDGGKTWRKDPSWKPAYYPPSTAVKGWYDEYENCARKTSGAWDGCASHAEPNQAKLQVYLGEMSMKNMAAVCPDATSLGQHNGAWVCQVGHFTSMIWDGVQTMGCAYSKSVNPVVVICRYKSGDTKDENTPNFNMQENQVSHVKKLAKTEAACKGAKPSGSWRVGPTQSAQASARQGSKDPVSSDQTKPARVAPPSRSASRSPPAKAGTSVAARAKALEAANNPASGASSGGKKAVTRPTRSAPASTSAIKKAVASGSRSAPASTSAIKQAVASGSRAPASTSAVRKAVASGSAGGTKTATGTKWSPDFANILKGVPNGEAYANMMKAEFKKPNPVATVTKKAGGAGTEVEIVIAVDTPKGRSTSTTTFSWG